MWDTLAGVYRQMCLVESDVDLMGHVQLSDLPPKFVFFVFILTFMLPHLTRGTMEWLR